MKLTGGSPLPAGAIAHAAYNDLRVRELKRVKRDDVGEIVALPFYEPMSRYCFHRRHVRKAKSAYDLIKLALAEPGIGQGSGKSNTRLVYSDIDQLWLALAVALERYG